MRRGRASAPAALAAALAAVLAGACTAGADQPAPGDSSLHRFLDTLADSTDRYFGPIAAPLDTAGLDSTLEARLERPWRGPGSRVRVSPRPLYTFNRVDGSLWGGSVALSDRRERLRLVGRLGRTTGSDRWLGGGELALTRRRQETLWRFVASGGRRTEPLDRDYGELRLSSLAALAWGGDRQSYLRRDGYSVGVTRAGGGWRAGLRYRDWRESPLAVATHWNMTHHALANPGNLAATFGRVRELSLDGLTRVPGTPFRVQLGHAIADGALGSDFDYRRTRLALAGEIAAGHHVSLVPQMGYGRLGGDPVPQAAFYLGGARTLRSLPGDSLGGTGAAIARLDVIGADDLLVLAHIPHPAMFPLQAGLFAAAGAVWGGDPFGGAGTARDGWPDRDAWRSEAGLSLLYRPGIPDEDAYLRVNLAWPLGPGGGRKRWSASYTRALDLLTPF